MSYLGVTATRRRPLLCHQRIVDRLGDPSIATLSIVLYRQLYMPQEIKLGKTLLGENVGKMSRHMIHFPPCSWSLETTPRLHQGIPLVPYIYIVLARH